ncbi:hypothetical protein AKJ37_03055 [candidate division MSBL1 archaeon SCGC-AAA259I09]|uniref:Uncharacterized protein n=2 Tax=candidate division MSBL1 TaxID=215777 RepID=A0A133UT86_9EURY|nr:hypothetical protein AKJ66_00880 [candidate division MSBL1 archaeon SCGC-AAA259E22]KXA97413.1 hypothetical protein AKJ37_03055 [candidate division MSBL1 archaeon SCGC-AAA259I09]
MPDYSKKTDLEPREVMKIADDFFGQDGLGLVKVSHSEDESCFEGEGSRVKIRACKGETTKVELESSEIDYQIKKFLKRL